MSGDFTPSMPKPRPKAWSGPVLPSWSWVISSTVFRLIRRVVPALPPSSIIWQKRA